MRLKYPVILASASPRRQELLLQLVPEFKVVPADVDEDGMTCDDPHQTALRLAREKALAVFALHPDHLVIGGDTVVALKGDSGWRLLGKPLDVADAHRILRELSGRTHIVVTGLALRSPRGLRALTETTEVTFRDLRDDEIQSYIATGQPMDKAGAYGLQDDSHSFIEGVKGSVTNVIGLPMEVLEEALRDA